MFLVKLMGGLGNQMFQYAFGRALSLKHNIPLALDLSSLGQKTGVDTPRNYELDIFNIEAQIATLKEIDKFSIIHNNKILKSIHNSFSFILPFFQVKEKQFCYNELKNDIHRNTMFVGYWQTEKYFENIKDIIKKDFQFKEPLEGLNAELATKIKVSNSVGMHIRRGDFISNPVTNKYHGTCNSGYYKNAISYLSQKISGNMKLFIFSDEPGWVKNNLQFNYETIYIENNNGAKSYEDLRLMILCKHNIIANSSFSWWAAYLNSNVDKVVVAPSQWFNNKTIDTHDLIPDGWIKM